MQPIGCKSRRQLSHRRLDTATKRWSQPQYTISTIGHAPTLILPRPKSDDDRAPRPGAQRNVARLPLRALRLSRLSIGTCALFSFYFRFIICRRRFALMPFSQPNRLLSRRCALLLPQLGGLLGLDIDKVLTASSRSSSSCTAAFVADLMELHFNSCHRQRADSDISARLINRCQRLVV